MATRGQSSPGTVKPISNISITFFFCLFFFHLLMSPVQENVSVVDLSLNIKSKCSVIAFLSCFACVYRQHSSPSSLTIHTIQVSNRI